MLNPGQLEINSNQRLELDLNLGKFHWAMPPPPPPGILLFDYQLCIFVGVGSDAFDQVHNKSCSKSGEQLLSSGGKGRTTISSLE